MALVLGVLFSIGLAIAAQGLHPTSATFAASTGPFAGPLTVSFSFSPSTVTIGNSAQGTVDIAGGVSPFTLWFNNTAPGCNPQSNPLTTSNPTFSFTCSPSSQGNFNVHVDVVDSSQSHGSAIAQLTVNSGGGGGGNSNNNGSNPFSIPSQLLTLGLIFVLVLVVALVALAAGVVAIAVLVPRRIRKLTEAIEKQNSPPKSGTPPAQ